MLTPEGRVKAGIRAALKAVGAYQFWPVQTGYGSSTLDCLACVPLLGEGHFLGIEVKRADGPARPTLRQRLAMEAIRAAGGRAVCINDPDDFARRLEALQRYAAR